MTGLTLTDGELVQLLQDALIGLRELDQSSHDVVHRIDQIKSKADQLGYWIDDGMNMHKWVEYDEHMQNEFCKGGEVRSEFDQAGNFKQVNVETDEENLTRVMYNVEKIKRKNVKIMIRFEAHRPR